jgi:hypothetical protein
MYVGSNVWGVHFLMKCSIVYWYGRMKTAPYMGCFRRNVPYCGTTVLALNYPYPKFGYGGNGKISLKE